MPNWAEQVTAIAGKIPGFLLNCQTNINSSGAASTTAGCVLPSGTGNRISQGFPITVREWYGVFLPGKAKPEVAQRAAAYLQTALSQSDLVTTMAQFGLEVKPSTPAALSEQMHADTEEWRRIIKQIGFTPES